ncbi:probable cytochrome P450 6a13 [Anthonomus grandis grandis]|uniref:probable cytochrome P450 6a13 n=1 Tax=Anthonomus grandis grandis TaxID=2921223 RepID=UPI0021650E12|nr:probable cytochrome P450 6a13 [Anthonomus grandis grandis]
MEWFVYLLSALITLATAIYFASKWRFSYWQRRGVAQLNPEFFYGDCRGMLTGDLSIGETFLDFYKKFRSKGLKYGGVYVSYRCDLVPVDPALIKDIMVKNFDHFTAHFPKSTSKSILSKNLFGLEGEQWKSTRKHLTPAFSSGKMKMMYETMLIKADGIDKMLDTFSSSREPTDIKEILQRLTIDVIANVGFGVDSSAIDDPDTEFVRQGRSISAPPKNRESYWGLFLRMLNVRRMRKDFSDSEMFFKSLVTDSIEYREKNKINRKDFIHLMIQLKNKGKVTDDADIFTKTENLKTAFDDDNITAQCLLFFIAGFETSATTMTFAIFELAQHPEIQEKIRQEANEVLERHGGKLTYEAMMELTYTESVIEETMRKYPPVPAIPRCCTKDYTIPGTDTVIAKGTSMFIPAWGLHMDPEYFPEPETFDPDRFSPENKKMIREYTYLPFGEGPRMCLGLRFGIMQSKVGLVTIVRKYKLSLNEKTAVPVKMVRDNLILAAQGGIWVNVQKI